MAGMLPKNGDLILRWEDGDEVRMGTVMLEAERGGLSSRVSVRMFWARFGMNLVRMGLRMIVRGRKWGK